MKLCINIVKQLQATYPKDGKLQQLASDWQELRAENKQLKLASTEGCLSCAELGAEIRSIKSELELSQVREAGLKEAIQNLPSLMMLRHLQDKLKAEIEQLRHETEKLSFLNAKH